MKLPQKPYFSSIDTLTELFFLSYFFLNIANAKLSRKWKLLKQDKKCLRLSSVSLTCL